VVRAAPVVCFLVFTSVALLVRSLLSAIYWSWALELPPFLMLDVHLPYALSSGITSELVSSLFRPAAAHDWLVRWLAGMSAICIHFLLVTSVRGTMNAGDQWIIFVGTWAPSVGIAALAATLVSKRLIRVA
jgi:hypothetical protein